MEPLRRYELSPETELALWVYAFATYVVYDLWTTSLSFTLMIEQVPAFATFTESNPFVRSLITASMEYATGIGEGSLVLNDLIVPYALIATKVAIFTIAILTSVYAHRRNARLGSQAVALSLAALGTGIVVLNAHILLYYA